MGSQEKKIPPEVLSIVHINYASYAVACYNYGGPTVLLYGTKHKVPSTTEPAAPMVPP